MGVGGALGRAKRYGKKPSSGRTLPSPSLSEQFPPRSGPPASTDHLSEQTARVPTWALTHIDDVGEFHCDKRFSWRLGGGTHSHCHHPGGDSKRRPGGQMQRSAPASRCPDLETFICHGWGLPGLRPKGGSRALGRSTWLEKSWTPAQPPGTA